MIEFPQTALVTGASSGIGRAVVRRLRKLGLRVWALARRRDRLEQLAVETGATPLVVDLQDTSSIYHILAELDIDILVNNAGVGRGYASLLEAGPGDIEQTIRTNVLGPIHVARVTLPRMVKQGRGHLIQIGSVAGLYPSRSPIYGASKSATHRFMQNMRTELLGTGVRCTEIAPGRVQTEFFDVAFDGTDGKPPPAGLRTLSSEDIAAAVVYAISAPSHVNISLIEVMPSDQAFGAVLTHHGTEK